MARKLRSIETSEVIVGEELNVIEASSRMMTRTRLSMKRAEANCLT